MKARITAKTPPGTVDQLLESVRTVLRSKLPLTWHLSEVTVGDFSQAADAMIQMTSPDGQRVKLHLHAKSRISLRDVAYLEAKLQKGNSHFFGAVQMIVAAYIPSNVRERLIDSGFSFADATGNIYVRSDAPALFIMAAGADKDPWRGPGRPRATLAGEPAAKVVRALLDFPGPWRIRNLVEVSKASTGSVYRVIEYLESVLLVNRSSEGDISVMDRPALMLHWSKDYQFLHSNQVTKWVAPRGLNALIDRMIENDGGGYAVTGSIAAAEWESYAPTKSAMIYCVNPEIAAEVWKLRPAETAANVLLALPAFDVVFERIVYRADGLRLAAPSQVAVDLLTGPGRAPSEGMELIEWMERNERSWQGQSESSRSS